VACATTSPPPTSLDWWATKVSGEGTVPHVAAGSKHSIDMAMEPQAREMPTDAHSPDGSVAAAGATPPLPLSGALAPQFEEGVVAVQRLPERVKYAQGCTRCHRHRHRVSVPMNPRAFSSRKGRKHDSECVGNVPLVKPSYRTNEQPSRATASLAPLPGLVRHENGRSHRRSAAAPKLERLDPRQRKGFVIVVTAAAGQAASCLHAGRHRTWAEIQQSAIWMWLHTRNS
jgi:hypothetical protein